MVGLKRRNFYTVMLPIAQYTQRIDNRAVARHFDLTPTEKKFIGKNT